MQHVHQPKQLMILEDDVFPTSESSPHRVQQRVLSPDKRPDLKSKRAMVSDLAYEAQRFSCPIPPTPVDPSTLSLSSEVGIVCIPFPLDPVSSGNAVRGRRDRDQVWHDPMSWEKLHRLRDLRVQCLSWVEGCTMRSCRGALSAFSRLEEKTP